MLRDSGSLDANDLVIELERLLSDRADVRRVFSERFPFVSVDELEDAGAAHVRARTRKCVWRDLKGWRRARARITDRARRKPRGRSGLLVIR